MIFYTYIQLFTGFLFPIDGLFFSFWERGFVNTKTFFMSDAKILALSSSRVADSGYLEMAAPLIREFLRKDGLNVAFIPFASVDDDHETYLTSVRDGLAGQHHNIHLVNTGGAAAIIEKADVIMVGGGNTFKLLHDIYKSKILNLIRDKVSQGFPYIGWSAGANIAGPTISTTNDMPIIEPESFNALGLLPFQINPHYHNIKVEGQNGETRDQRLIEFMMMNPGIALVGLPEGTALQLEQGILRFAGAGTGVLFQTDAGGKPYSRLIEPGEDLSFLM